MAIEARDTIATNVVPWPAASRYLHSRANAEYRQAAKASNEYERGRHAGRGEMCEELTNLPEALALLEEEDKQAHEAIQKATVRPEDKGL